MGCCCCCCCWICCGCCWGVARIYCVCCCWGCCGNCACCWVCCWICWCNNCCCDCCCCCCCEAAAALEVPACCWARFAGWIIVCDMITGPLLVAVFSWLSGIVFMACDGIVVVVVAEVLLLGKAKAFCNRRIKLISKEGLSFIMAGDRISNICPGKLKKFLTKSSPIELRIILYLPLSERWARTPRSRVWSC